MGDFTIICSALVAIAGIWLRARYSRKVRLKVGEIEAEAQTIRQVENLLARAQEIQRNQLAVIHKPEGSEHPRNF